MWRFLLGPVAVNPRYPFLHPWIFRWLLQATGDMGAIQVQDQPYYRVYSLAGVAAFNMFDAMPDRC